jgi:hypothetical protein
MLNNNYHDRIERTNPIDLIQENPSSINSESTNNGPTKYKKQIILAG